jgi:Raf kinase inhibitor-like YbhB/YbcL family protein
MAFKLRSAAFADGTVIPRRHTCEGEDVSPPLSWSDPPEGTGSLALVVDDPDAPGGTFTHWVAWDIDPAAGELGEGQPAPSEGQNDFGRVGYGGPCPPPGHGPHRYSHRLYALGEPLGVQPGADKVEVERALKGRSLGTAELMGTYERR